MLRPDKYSTNYSQNKPTDFVLHVKDPLFLFKKLLHVQKFY